MWSVTSNGDSVRDVYLFLYSYGVAIRLHIFSNRSRSPNIDNINNLWTTLPWGNPIPFYGYGALDNYGVACYVLSGRGAHEKVTVTVYGLLCLMVVQSVTMICL